MADERFRAQLEQYASRPQCQTFWCWAALWQALLLFEGRRLCQCQIARIVRFGRDLKCNCERGDLRCSDGVPDRYNRRDPVTLTLLQKANPRMDLIGFDRLQPSEVQKHLAAGHPIVAIANCQSSDHYLALTGICQIDENLYLLEYADPHLQPPGFATVRWHWPAAPDPIGSVGWMPESFLFVRSLPQELLNAGEPEEG